MNATNLETICDYEHLPVNTRAAVSWKILRCLLLSSCAIIGCLQAVIGTSAYCIKINKCLNCNQMLLLINHNRANGYWLVVWQSMVSLHQWWYLFGCYIFCRPDFHLIDIWCFNELKSFFPEIVTCLFFLAWLRIVIIMCLKASVANLLLLNVEIDLIFIEWRLILFILTSQEQHFP